MYAAETVSNETAAALMARLERRFLVPSGRIDLIAMSRELTAPEFRLYIELCRHSRKAKRS